MDAKRERQRRETLTRIKDCLPNRAERIESEYRANPGFKALCDDFQLCALAREKWEQSEAPVAPERRHEYAEWLEELLQEIEDWLEQSARAAESAR